MTTTDTPNKYRYEGNGSTDTFAFSGRVFAVTDLVVEIITRATDALVETLTINTDYTVTIASNGTASVEVTNALKIPSSTQDIQLRRVLAQTQSVSLPTGTVFPAKVVEAGLDRVTALVQDLDEAIGRSLKLPPQTSATVALTVEPEDDAILAWDGVTGQLKNGPTTASFTDATATAVAAAATATTQAGIATTQAGLASASATASGLQADYAEEWAINPEDDPVSVAAGGDDSTTYSALHWAAKAEEFAQSINLPTLGAADTVLQVNAAGNALEYEKIAISNIADSALIDLADKWTPASASGAASLELAEDTDNGTNKITLKAPASLASDYNFVLPTTDGNNLEFLQTDGSGNTSWSAVTVPTAASQAEQETGTDTTVFVTPGRQQYHPSSCKAWALVAGTGSITTSYNCSSWTDSATGSGALNFTVSFSSSNYACVVGSDTTGSSSLINRVDPTTTSRSAGAIGIFARNNAGTAADPNNYHIACYGDQ